MRELQAALGRQVDVVSEHGLKPSHPGESPQGGLAALRDDVERLRDILEAIARIAERTSPGKVGLFANDSSKFGACTTFR
jgi:hypothetical protein